MRYFKSYILLIVLGFIALCGCNNWDDHVKLSDQAGGDNLLQKLKANADLSIFVQCLEKTGYDKVLASSKDFTVWAPNNAACASLQGYLTSDPTDTLTKIIANHIAYLQYPFQLKQTSLRIKTLYGKYLDLTSESTQVMGANLIQPYDQYASNGLLHVVDKVLMPRLTIWDYVKTNAEYSYLYQFLKIYDGKYFDPAASTKKGVDSLGRTVYDSVKVASNKYLLDVASLNSEDSVYTYIVLSSTAFANEEVRFWNNCLSYSLAATDSASKRLVVNDFAIRGKYTLDNMPSTLVSTTGVTVPFDKSKVKATYEASNGIVYVLDECSIPAKDKFQSIKIEAENSTYRYRMTNYTISSGLLSTWYYNDPGYSALVYTRYRINASSGYDVTYKGNTNAGSGLMYGNIKLYSNITYKFYWVAVNDLGVSVVQYPLLHIYYSNNLFSQSVLDDYQSTSSIIAMDGSPSLYKQEVYLGQKNLSLMGKEVRFLVLSGNGSAVANTPITLDYIKIVPVIQ